MVSSSVGGPTITAGSWAGSNVLVGENDSVSKQFKAVIKGITGAATTSSFVFNFNENDSRYIRKVFNTNPQRTNTAITSDLTHYWLGETFDRHLAANISSTAFTYASIVEIQNDVTPGSNYLAPLQGAQSPQIISNRQSPTDTPKNLFTVRSLGQPGDWTNRNIKVSIQDIARSNTAGGYGSFSVVVRHLSDSDNVVRVIEQFTGCTLNPDDLNYVGRKVGTRYQDWNEEERRYTQQGDWPNNSVSRELLSITMRRLRLAPSSPRPPASTATGL